MPRSRRTASRLSRDDVDNGIVSKMLTELVLVEHRAETAFAKRNFAWLLAVEIRGVISSSFIHAVSTSPAQACKFCARP
jgi:hypothetical protein